MHFLLQLRDNVGFDVRLGLDMVLEPNYRSVSVSTGATRGNSAGEGLDPLEGLHVLIELNGS